MTQHFTEGQDSALEKRRHPADEEGKEYSLREFCGFAMDQLKEKMEEDQLQEEPATSGREEMVDLILMICDVEGGAEGGVRDIDRFANRGEEERMIKLALISAELALKMWKESEKLEKEEERDPVEECGRGHGKKCERIPMREGGERRKELLKAEEELRESLGEILRKAGNKEGWLGRLVHKSCQYMRRPFLEGCTRGEEIWRIWRLERRIEEVIHKKGRYQTRSSIEIKKCEREGCDFCATWNRDFCCDGCGKGDEDGEAEREEESKKPDGEETAGSQREDDEKNNQGKAENDEDSEEKKEDEREKEEDEKDDRSIKFSSFLEENLESLAGLSGSRVIKIGDEKIEGWETDEGGHLKSLRDKKELAKIIGEEIIEQELWREGEEGFDRIIADSILDDEGMRLLEEQLRELGVEIEGNGIIRSGRESLVDATGRNLIITSLNSSAPYCELNYKFLKKNKEENWEWGYKGSSRRSGVEEEMAMRALLRGGVRAVVVGSVGFWEEKLNRS